MTILPLFTSAPYGIVLLYCWQILVTEDSMNCVGTWINVIFSGSWWDLQELDPDCRN